MIRERHLCHLTPCCFSCVKKASSARNRYVSKQVLRPAKWQSVILVVSRQKDLSSPEPDLSPPSCLASDRAESSPKAPSRPADFQMWLKIEQQGQTAGCGPGFHLPGFHFGTGFLSHSQIEISNNKMEVRK